MLEFLIICIHQLLFQGMFVAKNVFLKKVTGHQIRGKNTEATVSIIYFAIFIITSLIISYFKFNSEGLETSNEVFILVVSLGILMINLIISALSLIHLKDSWRVGVLENQKTDLVSTGIYRFTRNPYFLSYLLMFAAYTLLLQSLSLLAFSLIGFLLIHTMILKEEIFLKSLHGDNYLDYQSRVPRYFII